MLTNVSSYAISANLFLVAGSSCIWVSHLAEWWDRWSRYHRLHGPEAWARLIKEQRYNQSGLYWVLSLLVVFVIFCALKCWCQIVFDVCVCHWRCYSWPLWHKHFNTSFGTAYKQNHKDEKTRTMTRRRARTITRKMNFKDIAPKLFSWDCLRGSCRVMWLDSPKQPRIPWKYSNNDSLNKASVISPNNTWLHRPKQEIASTCRSIHALQASAIVVWRGFSICGEPYTQHMFAPHK